MADQTLGYGNRMVLAAFLPDSPGVYPLAVCSALYGIREVTTVGQMSVEDVQAVQARLLR
jgi:hypothetical protein